MSGVRNRANRGSGGGSNANAQVSTEEAATSTTSNKSDSAASIIAKLAVASACGFVFGNAINRSGVANATELRSQFDFSSQIMLKTFLSATGTSIATLSLMKLVPSWQRDADTTADAYRTQIGVPASVIGAFVLGVGMTVCGACPGTIWAQIGAGSQRSLITLAGGITAGAVHGVLADRLEKFTTWSPLSPNKASLTDVVSNSDTRAAIGLSMSAMMFAVIAVVDRLAGTGGPVFPRSVVYSTWSPVFAGMCIGLLQLPLTLTLRKNVGSASTMQTLASMAFVCTDKFPQLNKMKWGVHRWWQVVYLMTAVVGSAAATRLTGKPWYSGSDITPAHAFIGGFLIIFGSRIAGGCTSGHGISGAGHLMWRSFAATAAIFAGAIAAKMVLQI